MFIYGEVQERKNYLMNLANEYKYSKDIEQPIVVYTEYSGLPDCENTSCEQITADLLERDHIEFVLSSLVLERLSKILPVKN